MINNKGQALVEFIIIVPIFMLIALGVIDFGNILYQRYEMGSDIDVVADLFRQDKLIDINNYLDGKDIYFSHSTVGNLEKLVLTKNVNVFTPGLNLVLGNPYTIEVDRVIYNE